MDNPPVNALTVAGWFELATHRPGARRGRRRCGSSCCGPRAGASTPASTSRRCRPTEGFDALIGANRGCYEAFAAVYECEVPVIAAVNGFCLGGGIGLVGNADVIVAADDATFGLPEVDRGALGAATHLSRLVPQHKMRAMVYTSATATAAGAARLRLGARGRAPGRAARRRLARWPRQIAAKSPTVIRAAKESLNGIDLWDVKRQLPLRAGLHLRAQPVGRGRRAPRRLRRQARHGRDQVSDADRDLPGPKDKRMTEDDVVGRLRVGHDHRHRRVGEPAQADVARAGHPAQRPHRPPPRHLRRARGRHALRRRARSPHLTFAFVSPDVGPAAVLEPHFRAARQSGAIACTELDEGMLLPRPPGRGVAGAVPAHPGRPRLGPVPGRPRAAHGPLALPGPRRRRGRGADRPAGHPPRRRARATSTWATSAATPPSPAPTSTSTTSCSRRPSSRFVSVERIVPTGDLVDAAGDVTRLRISRLFVDGVVEAPNGAHPTSCDPDYGRDEAFQKEYLGTAKDPELWEAFRGRVAVVPDRGRLPGRPGRPTREEDADERHRPVRARDPGRRLRGGGGRLLPGRRRAPRQPDRHHPDDRRPPGPGHASSPT